MFVNNKFKSVCNDFEVKQFVKYNNFYRINEISYSSVKNNKKYIFNNYELQF